MLGGILVLAVVGLGLGAPALAVAVAALVACLSEAVLPRVATVGVIYLTHKHNYLSLRLILLICILLSLYSYPPGTAVIL